MGSACSGCFEAFAGRKRPHGERLVTLRPRADPALCLCPTRSSLLTQGGWIHMWKQGDPPEVYGQWVLADGRLRPKANTEYCMALMKKNGCKDGGQVHMWRNPEAEDEFSKWDIEESATSRHRIGEVFYVLRPRACPKYCLCLRRDGVRNGGSLHVWSFTGNVPDIFGEWQIEDVDTQAGGARLGPAAVNFEAALQGSAADRSPARRPAAPLSPDLQRVPLLEGFEEFGNALEKIQGGLGKHLRENLQKLRRAKADASEGKYTAWLLSEVPVHAAKGYKEYLDDSAAMGNLWLAYTLEFFVEMFANLDAGAETKQACDSAYRKTLQARHNMVQRSAFQAAVRKLPSREKMLRLLGGEQYKNEISEFVAKGRSVVRLCMEADATVSAELQRHRAKR